MLVGSRLRRLRMEAGISREQAGEAIRASEWKIHRLENGQVGFKERDVVDLLGLYGVSDPGEVAAFVILAREANLPGWWQHYGDVLLQVLPFTAGMPPAMPGAFSILRFGDEESLDVVYFEHLTNAIYLDNRQ